MNVLLSSRRMVSQSSVSTSGVRLIRTSTPTYSGPDPYGPSFGVIIIVTTFSPLGLKSLIILVLGSIKVFHLLKVFSLRGFRKRNIRRWIVTVSHGVR
jgi:hypothetical protein